MSLLQSQGFSHPGTISGDFKREELHAWRDGFYSRLRAHADRAAANVVAADPDSEVCQGYPGIVAFAGKRQVRIIGFGIPGLFKCCMFVKSCLIQYAWKTCRGCSVLFDSCKTLSCPSLALALLVDVMLSQWEELFYDAGAPTRARLKGGKAGPFQFGRQPADLVPPEWPFPSISTEVFVLPSSSGAAAMTNAARERPYLELGRYMSQHKPWERQPTAGDNSQTSLEGSVST